MIIYGAKTRPAAGPVTRDQEHAADMQKLFDMAIDNALGHPRKRHGTKCKNRR